MIANSGHTFLLQFVKTEIVTVICDASTCTIILQLLFFVHSNPIASWAEVYLKPNEGEWVHLKSKKVWHGSNVFFFFKFFVVYIYINNWASVTITWRSELRSSVVKVARVVNVKLGFMDWFFYNLLTLINWCKFLYKSSEKSLLLSRNQVSC